MAKIPFQKLSTTPAQQVELLKSRGVCIPDASTAEKYLSFHNYYYISGYVYYFEQKGPERTHKLARETTFNDIVQLVNFDHILRGHCLKAVLSIEPALRCVMAREIALALGPFGLESPAIYREPHKHSALLNKLNAALADHRNEPFIAHFSNKYFEPIPPVWVMIEVLTFGTISTLYGQLRTDLQKKIASAFKVDHFILVSWLRALTELRNTCAHHGRLWNKVFVNYPKIRSADHSFPIMPERKNRLGSFVPLISHLLAVLGENPSWIPELKAILQVTGLIKSRDLGLQKMDF